MFHEVVWHHMQGVVEFLVTTLLQDRPYPSEITVLIQHTVTVHSSVIDIERYFSTYFTCRCGIE